MKTTGLPTNENYGVTYKWKLRGYIQKKTTGLPTKENYGVTYKRKLRGYLQKKTKGPFTNDETIARNFYRLFSYSHDSLQL